MMATDEPQEMEVDKKVVDTKHIAVDPSEFPHLLKQFYDRLFPYHYFYRWLAYGNTMKDFFQNREFSFTLKDDIYIRYRSYANEEEMTEDIKKMNPYKIDIGAVFSGKPKDHKKIKASQFKPIARELVFDIDMTDYDEIRTCCKGAAICKRCWPFMNAAAKIVDTALREDFGFEHILWVYSGRRGIHAWICDKRARNLSNEQRSAVAEWLSVIAGGSQVDRKVNLRTPIFPAVQRAISISKRYFENWAIKPQDQGGQDILKSEQSRSNLVKIIGNKVIEDDLLESWNDTDSSSETRWGDVCKAIDFEKKSNINLRTRKQEIMLQYTYPRLDVHVSTQMNHLLKSPFVVHPKTGRVCVPFDIDDVDNFDPFSVPTINDLMDELDKYKETDAASPKKNYEKTSLNKAMKLFQSFIERCEQESKADLQMMKETSKMDAVNKGDW